MLNCKDASHLESQSYERPLKFTERVGLRLHHLICDGCRGFSQQLKLIRLACRRIDESKGSNVDAPGLSPEAKARVLKELASKQGNPL